MFFITFVIQTYLVCFRILNNTYKLFLVITYLIINFNYVI